jgi:hypothetical protein
MRISKYAFLVLMACASPALATDLVPEQLNEVGITIIPPTDNWEWEPVFTGQCNLQKIPSPTSRKVVPDMPSCIVTFVRKHDQPEPNVQSSPLKQTFNFVWGNTSAPGVILFPGEKNQSKPPVKESTSPDRAPSAVPIIPPSASNSEAPAIAAPVEPPPRPLVRIPPVFNPENIYQQCGRTPYNFTYGQAYDAYIKFDRPPGYFPYLMSNWWDDPVAWKIYHSWQIEDYSNACWIMQNY